MTYALRSNTDHRLLSMRFTEDEAAAAMRLDPWLTDETFGDVTLVRVDDELCGVCHDQPVESGQHVCANNRCQAEGTTR